MKTKNMKTKPRSGRSAEDACSAIPRAQALIFEPDLSHSVWTDVMHRKRSRKSLEAMLRKAVRSGEYVGYRLITIEAKYVGISWPNTNKRWHGADRIECGQRLIAVAIRALFVGFEGRQKKSHCVRK